ncbi:MAG: MtnX-like HAD-IB family phosphatase [Calditrichaeota bacterium]|nr:MtnX-like HAD-IB family phosphatase [Calditrichota bacterium]
MKKKKIKIFVDFDGTISMTDVGDALFQKYADADWDKIVQDWKDGKISSREVFTLGCENTRITKEELFRFSDAQKIDPYFKIFFNHCRQKNYPVTVLSDGLDLYIKRILAKEGLGDIEVIANELTFIAENKMRVEFPYYEKGCLVCGNCKGYQIREHREDGELIVYVGDGYSDRCAVPEADVLFAKDDLKNYCFENGMSFHEFDNFKDVLNELKNIERKLS